MTNNKPATTTTDYQDLRNILLEDLERPRAYGAQDEERVATIVLHAQEILNEIFWDDDADEAPTIDRATARRVLRQVARTYNEAILTAQRRADAILNALRMV